MDKRSSLADLDDLPNSDEPAERIVENVEAAMKQNEPVIAGGIIGTIPGSRKSLKSYFCKHNTNLA